VRSGHGKRGNGRDGCHGVRCVPNRYLQLRGRLIFVHRMPSRQVPRRDGRHKLHKLRRGHVRHHRGRNRLDCLRCVQHGQVRVRCWLNLVQRLRRGPLPHRHGRHELLALRARHGELHHEPHDCLPRLRSGLGRDRDGLDGMHEVRRGQVLRERHELSELPRGHGERHSRRP